jgi:arylsulfatase
LITRINMIMTSPRIIGLLLLTLLVHVAAADRIVADDNPPRPNIVVILADDLGYSDLGCYGSEIATPNIDRLAEQGVRFRQFYNNGRCCPSRASILTGQYPAQVGVAAMIDGYAKWIRDAADLPSYDDHLSAETPTIAELLSEAGYRTMMSGKWHLGQRPAEWPSARGFDRSFALIPGAMNYYGGETTGPRADMALDDQKFVPPHDGFFATDAFTDRAIEFLDETNERDDPFFLYLPFNAPHWPLHAPPEDIAKYDGKYDQSWQETRQRRRQRMIDLDVIEEMALMAPMDRGDVKPWDALTPEKRDEWARRMEIYAAQVTRMDQNIGRVLDQLDAMGVADDTLVIFLSDNGGAAEDPRRGQPNAELGSRDSFRGYARPWASVSNTPWRRHKVTMYEGGISTPVVVRWPVSLPADARGKFVDGPAHLIDLVPTFLELAGAASSEDQPNQLEGRNIASMFRGESMPADRTLCWEHEGNRAILKGTWKLVELANSPNGWELYDLAADRAEQHNLALEQPEVVRELADDYNQWAKRCGVLPWSEIQAKRKDR